MKQVYNNWTNKVPSLYFISFVPILLFFITVYKYAVNVPYMDDMELVEIINIIKSDSSLLLEVLLRQQNDHRPAFSRIGMIIAYVLSGGINIKLIILLGYLNLMLLGWTFFQIHKSQNITKWSFLPIPFLLFSPIVYQDHLWAITSFQYTLSIAFSLLSLYYLRPEKKHVWYYSFFYCIAATLTNLDSIGVPLIAILWLVVQSRWKETKYYLLFTVTYFLIYFHNFKLSSASDIPLTVHSIVPWIASFLAITGSIAKLASDSYAINLSILIGLIIILTFIGTKLYSFFSKPGYTLHNDLLNFTDIGFIRLLSSMVFISLGRFSSGTGVMMSIRFQIYSVSMLILFYLFVLTLLKGRSRNLFIKVSLIATLLIFPFSYFKYNHAIKYYSNSLKADTYNYPHNNVFLHQYFVQPDPDKSFYRFYDFPIYFQEEIVNNWKYESRTSEIDEKYLLSVRRIKNEGSLSNYLTPLIEFNVRTSDDINPNNDYYLLLDALEDKGGPYLVAIRRNGGWFNQLITTSSTLTFFGDIPDKIPKGAYSISLGWLNNGEVISKTLSKKTVL